jgi:hypothetical protein
LRYASIRKQLLRGQGSLVARPALVAQKSWR